MRNVFVFSTLVMIMVLSIFMAGCGDEFWTIPPVKFVAANPPSGSTIERYDAITVTFDAAPGNVSVNRGAATTTGQTVTISGPFDTGSLSLDITWADGFHTLNYTVYDATPVPATIIQTHKVTKYISISGRQIGLFEFNYMYDWQEEVCVDGEIVDWSWRSENPSGEAHVTKDLVRVEGNCLILEGRILAKTHPTSFLKIWVTITYQTSTVPYTLRLH